MDERILIKYLQDIVNLETQKRIAGNTYNRLLVAEKDNAYARNVNSDNNRDECSSSIIKEIKWLPLLGKIYLGFIGAAIIAMILKWIILIFFQGFGLSEKEVEIFCVVSLSIASIIFLIRKEVLAASGRIEKEKSSQVQYAERIKKGKIILTQIQKDKPVLKNTYFQCEETLKKMYALNIVHSQYQYLEACGMFLQYLRTGRTHCLEQRGGDTGAYNLFESDLKFNVIKGKLDQVLRNQEILYGALNEINSNVEMLCNSFGRIEQYAQQTANNTKISAWCNTVTAVNTYAIRNMQEEYLCYK